MTSVSGTNMTTPLSLRGVGVRGGEGGTEGRKSHRERLLKRGGGGREERG